jgi:hypothetical protein
MTTSRYSNCKRINRLVRQLVLDGWKYSLTTHPRITTPCGRHSITFSFTPSDGNAHRAFERDVRRLKTQLQKQELSHA